MCSFAFCFPSAPFFASESSPHVRQSRSSCCCCSASEAFNASQRRKSDLKDFVDLEGFTVSCSLQSAMVIPSINLRFDQTCWVFDNHFVSWGHLKFIDNSLWMNLLLTAEVSSSLHLRQSAPQVLSRNRHFGASEDPPYKRWPSCFRGVAVIGIVFCSIYFVATYKCKNLCLSFASISSYIIHILELYLFFLYLVSFLLVYANSHLFLSLKMFIINILHISN